MRATIRFCDLSSERDSSPETFEPILRNVDGRLTLSNVIKTEDVGGGKFESEQCGILKHHRLTAESGGFIGK